MRLFKTTARQWAGLPFVCLGLTATLSWIFRWRISGRVIPAFSEMGLVALLLFISGGIACWLLGTDDTRELRPAQHWVVAACVCMLTIFPVLMLFEQPSGIAVVFH